MFEEVCARVRMNGPMGSKGIYHCSTVGFIPRLLTAVGCRFMGK